MPDEDFAQDHLAVCRGLAEVLEGVRHWEASTPCDDWNIRQVLEHVIGFHDVLLLRPLSAKPTRHRDDPLRRWSATVDALRRVLLQVELFDGIVAVPAVGDRAPTTLDTRTIVPMLTQDVLVHTWDIARAADLDDQLDERLCAVFLGRLPADDQLQRSGMFGPALAVPRESTDQAALLARLGRDPAWVRP